MDCVLVMMTFLLSSSFWGHRGREFHALFKDGNFPGLPLTHRSAPEGVLPTSLAAATPPRSLAAQVLRSPALVLLLQFSPEADFLLAQSRSGCPPLYPPKRELGLKVIPKLNPFNFSLCSPPAFGGVILGAHVQGVLGRGLCRNCLSRSCLIPT